MTIMLEPEDKARIEARARAKSISTGEFVRRVSLSEGEEEIDEALLDAMLTEFQANIDAMRATLAASHARTQAMLAQIDALRATVHGPR